MLESDVTELSFTDEVWLQEARANESTIAKDLIGLVDIVVDF